MSRLSISVALGILGLGSLVVPAAALVAQAVSNRDEPTQRAQAPGAGTGILVGTVVNEQQQPVAHAQVQAFAMHTILREQVLQTEPCSARSSGSASTDTEGRFRIKGLEPGECVVAAELPSLTSGTSKQTSVYATTFYPSTSDPQHAIPVSVPADGGSPLHIQLVRVNGARVSGSVVSASGRATGGMSVRLQRRFGNFGSESTVDALRDNGTFEISGVPPGWYRLTVGDQSSGARGIQKEFAATIIRVHERDLGGLSLVLGTGATVSGRVVSDAGVDIQAPVGLQVHASQASWRTAPIGSKDKASP